MNCLSDIAHAIMLLENEAELCEFLEELMTPAEIEALSKRWRILKMLSEGKSQRDIANKLQVSLCKVTRGSKIIKKDGNVVSKVLV